MINHPVHLVYSLVVYKSLKCHFSSASMLLFLCFRATNIFAPLQRQIHYFTEYLSMAPMATSLLLLSRVVKEALP